MSENILESLAKELRSIFARKKKERDGKYNPMERNKSMEVWLKVAVNCKQANADPEAFIQAAFDYNTVAGGPFPNMLWGSQAVRWYEQKVCYISENQGPLDAPDDVLARIYHQEFTDAQTLMLSQVMFPTYRDFLNIEIETFQIPVWVRYFLLQPWPDDRKKFEARTRTAILSNPKLHQTLHDMGWDLSFVYPK